MIYTTYFANLGSLPPSVVPISICGKAPSWWTGQEFKKLAPKWEFFSEWKKNRNNHYYVKCFKEQVLDNLVIHNLLVELRVLAHSDEIALVCYERPEDFCHRHLVANWLRENGVKVREW